MTDLDKVVQDTAGYEGYKPQPYKDTRGLWTVGEGTCLETNPIDGSSWKFLLDNRLVTLVVSGQGARYLLRGKLAADLRGLVARFPSFATLPDLVQTLLLEMAYQLGDGDLLQFTTFDNLISQHRFQDAAVDARTTAWYRETPSRAENILTQLEGIRE